MNIGNAARRTGVPAKTIRYYESIGLMPPAPRAENGYRDYGNSELETLKFIHRARNLGFPLKDVRDLLALWHDKQRASADVKRLALKHIDEIGTRIAELESIRDTLADLAERCHGDHMPECPIIDGLADGRLSD